MHECGLAAVVEGDNHFRMIGVRRVQPLALVVHARHVLDRCIEDVQDLIEVVRTPIEDRTAGHVGIGVPVIARTGVAADKTVVLEYVTDQSFAD